MSNMVGEGRVDGRACQTFALRGEGINHTIIPSNRTISHFNIQFDDILVGHAEKHSF